ncbi:hypothetical protein [Metallibacterium sp.]|uniref:hypothetical protein n=1 Tax=Metallibacterium sp. TaxID=2940281 RepID=UPI00261B8201|nr:hypothetical protein [Metallibacterium sp.]
MTTTTAASRYAKIVSALSAHPSVSVGGGKRGFGASALQTGNRIFCMLTSKDEFVVKLPKERVAELVASGDGRQFDPGHGRLMKEWLAVEPTSNQDWLDLANEALEFVGR